MCRLARNTTLGPVVLMCENYRTGLLWRLMSACPYIVWTAAGGIQERLVMTGYDPALKCIGVRRAGQLPP